jgi:hypothetical protein
MQRLRSSNADADLVVHLIAQQHSLPSREANDAELRRWIRRVGRGEVRDLFRLLIAVCRALPEDGAQADRLRALHRRTSVLLRERTPLSVNDLEVSGEDLRRAGIPPGPRYGRILRELLERVTEEPALNERERLLDLVQAIMERPSR